MSDTTDILKIVSGYLDTQERKKQQEFENSFALSKLARDYKRQESIDAINFSKTVAGAQKTIGDTLETIGLTRKELGMPEISSDLDKIINTTGESYMKKMEEVNNLLGTFQQATNVRLEEMNKLFSYLQESAMSDQNPMASQEEINNAIGKFENSTGESLSPYHMRWVQGWADENLKVSNAREDNSERIIQNDIYSDLADDLFAGVPSQQAIDNVVNKINNDEFGYNETQKQIAKKIVMTIDDKNIKPAQNDESNESILSVQKEKLEKQRQTIKEEMDVVAKIGNSIEEFSSPLDLSSENIAGEIENLTIGVGNQLVKAWDDTNIYWGIDDDLQTLLRQARKTNDIEDYKSVIKYVEDHPDQIKEFDLDPESRKAGSVMEGRGAYLTRGIKLLGKMKKYNKDYIDLNVRKSNITGINLTNVLNTFKDEPNSSGENSVTIKDSTVTVYHKGEKNSTVYIFKTNKSAKDFYNKKIKEFNNE